MLHMNPPIVWFEISVLPDWSLLVARKVPRRLNLWIGMELDHIWSALEGSKTLARGSGSHTSNTKAERRKFRTDSGDLVRLWQVLCMLMLVQL